MFSFRREVRRLHPCIAGWVSMKRDSTHLTGSRNVGAYSSRLQNYTWLDLESFGWHFICEASSWEAE